MKPTKKEIKKHYSVRVKPSDYEFLKKLFGNIGYALEKLADEMRSKK